MLVLTRNVNQRIFINGEEIKIVVLSVRGNQVKIGIEAPSHINILREELFLMSLPEIKNKNVQFIKI